jgi:hypothetical protein
LKDPVCERKLKNLDYEMNFQDINFENFQNSLKKYGYSGQVNEKQFKEVQLDKKYLKS